MFRRPLRCEPLPGEAEILVCVLYWGLGRQVEVDQVETVLADLPDWLQDQRVERGAHDPMIQHLIIDHLEQSHRESNCVVAQSHGSAIVSAG